MNRAQNPNEPRRPIWFLCTAWQPIARGLLWLLLLAAVWEMSSSSSSRLRAEYPVPPPSDPNAPTTPVPVTPSVQFSNASYGVLELEGTATIRVTLSSTATSPVSVDYATSDGTAGTGIDYTPTSGTLTFAAGETSRTFNVPIVNDANPEPTQTVNLALSNPQGATLGSPSTAVLSIIDDLMLNVQFSMANYLVHENSGTATIEVTLSWPATEPIAVFYSTGDGTGPTGAVSPTDYTSVSGTLNFAVGDLMQTFSVPIVPQTYPGPEKILHLLLDLPPPADPNNPTVSLGVPSAATLTIANDIPYPVVTFAPSPVLLTPGAATNLVVSVTPSNAAVTFTSSDSTVASLSGAAPNFAVTGNVSGAAQIDAVMNGVVFQSVPVYVVTVNLSPNPIVVARGSSAPLTATVTPSAAAGYVSFSSNDDSIAFPVQTPAELTVCGSSPGTTQINALLGDPGATSLQSVPAYVVSVEFSPNPVISTPGSTVTLTATVTPSDVASNVTFASLDPTVASVEGSAPNLTVTGAGYGVTTIEADLYGTVIGSVPVVPVSVSFAPSPVYLPNGGSATVQATITPASAADQVTFSTADGVIATATANGSAVLISGISPGTTQLLATTPWAVVATAEIHVVGVQFDLNPAYLGVGMTSSWNVTVTPPNAASEVTYSVGDSTIASFNSAGSTLTGLSAGITQVTALLGTSSVGSGTVNVVSVQLSPSPVAVLVGQSTGVSATVVPADAGDILTYECVDTDLASVSGSGLNPMIAGIAGGKTQLQALLDGQVVAVVDVNVQVLVGFSSPTYSVVETTESIRITVELATPSSQTVTVDYATADGTATANQDYVPASGTLTFSPSVTSRTFDIGINNVVFAAGTKTVNLTLSNPSMAQVGGNSLAVLTITDVLPTVVFVPDPLYVGVGQTFSTYKAIVTPPAAASLVTFSSANPTIATVQGSADALTVVGMTTGTVQINATIGSSNVGSGTVIVNNVPMSVQIDINNTPGHTDDIGIVDKQVPVLVTLNAPEATGPQSITINAWDVASGGGYSLSTRVTFADGGTTTTLQLSHGVSQQIYVSGIALSLVDDDIALTASAAGAPTVALMANPPPGAGIINIIGEGKMIEVMVYLGSRTVANSTGDITADSTPFAMSRANQFRIPPREWTNIWVITSTDIREKELYLRVLNSSDDNGWAELKDAMGQKVWSKPLVLTGKNLTESKEGLPHKYNKEGDLQIRGYTTVLNGDDKAGTVYQTGAGKGCKLVLALFTNKEEASKALPAAPNPDKAEVKSRPFAVAAIPVAVEMKKRTSQLKVDDVMIQGVDHRRYYWHVVYDVPYTSDSGNYPADLDQVWSSERIIPKEKKGILSVDEVVGGFESVYSLDNMGKPIGRIDINGYMNAYPTEKIVDMFLAYCEMNKKDPATFVGAEKKGDELYLDALIRLAKKNPPNFAALEQYYMFYDKRTGMTEATAALIEHSGFTIKITLDMDKLLFVVSKQPAANNSVQPGVLADKKDIPIPVYPK